MKKLFILSLCGAAIISVGAQKKNVDAAKKLAGKTEKITEARSLISEAINNPETSGSALTFKIAGDIEWDAYDNNKKLQSINNEAAVSPEEMADMLVNGYGYYIKAMELDALPNEKGEIKPKYTQKIQERIARNINDFYEAGATRYNQKRYYPDAYTAFTTFADNSQVEDTIKAMGYFYAGVSAYSDKQLEKARESFANAVKKGYTDPNGIIYQIACIEGIAGNDSTKQQQAKTEILELSRQGYSQFGISNPFFISTIVDSYHSLGNDNEAFNILDKAMAEYPDNAMLYGLSGWLNSVNGKDMESLEAYSKSVSLPDVSADILIKAARKYYQFAANQLGAIEGNSEEARAKRLEMKTKYFEPAMELANRAETISTDPSEKSKIQNVKDQIEYILSTNY